MPPRESVDARSGQPRPRHRRAGRRASANPAATSRSPVDSSTVLDWAAVTLAAISLALPWDDLAPGATQPAVVGAIAATLAAAVLPHLAGSNGVAAEAQEGQAPILRIIRAVLVTPLLLLVLLIMLRATDGRSGVGPGVFLGTCAAVLAGHPRQVGADGRVERAGAYQWIGVILASMAALWGAIDAIQPLRYSWGEPTLWAAIIPSLAMCASVLRLAADLARDVPHTPMTMTVYAGLWFLVGLSLTLGWLTDNGLETTQDGVPSLLAPGLGGTVTLLGAAAVIAFRPYREVLAVANEQDQPATHLPRWIHLASHLLTISVILLAGEMLRVVVVLTADSDGMSIDTPSVATLASVDALCLAAVATCRWLLIHHAPLGRLVTVVGALVACAVNFVLMATERLPVRLDLVLLHMLALIIVFALTWPRSVRLEFGPLLPRDGQSLIRRRVPEYAGAPQLPCSVPAWPTADELFDEPAAVPNAAVEADHDPYAPRPNTEVNAVPGEPSRPQQGYPQPAGS